MIARSAGPLPKLPASFRLDGRSLALDPRDPAFYENPYPAYAALHRAAPLAFWREAGCPAVADHGLVSRILRDRRFGRILPADEEGRADYSGKPAHISAFYGIEANSLLDLEPPTHTRLRGLVTRAFVSRRIERLEPAIEALAHSLIDRFAENGVVELVEAFATPIPVAVIADLIGIERDAAPSLLDWSHRMVAMYRLNRDRAAEDSANAAALEFAAFLRGVIAHKRRHPGDDLVSALIAAETEEGRLSEPEMASTIILLLNAGHEATVHQIGNAAKAILELPEPAALFSSEAAASAAVEEALRFDTPLHLFRRVAREDLELADGVRMKRGEEVALLLGAANRDPNVFAQPDRFDPSRDAAGHVSFGAGIHFCVGAPLARLELRIALGALFRRLPGLRLAAVPRYRDSWHFRGLERLDVAFPPVTS